MSDRITARSLMVTQFVTISDEASLRDGLTALTSMSDSPERPIALIVVDPAGGYRGMLTSRLLLRSVLV